MMMFFVGRRLKGARETKCPVSILLCWVRVFDAFWDGDWRAPSSVSTLRARREAKLFHALYLELADVLQLRTKLALWSTQVLK